MMQDPTIQDFATSYTDDAAPKVDDPAEKLFGDLSKISKATAARGVPGEKLPTSTATAPAAQGRGSPARLPTQTSTATPAARGGPGVPTPGAVQTPGVVDTKGPNSPEGIAILARLAPLGIKNLDDLRKKTDVELRKLSTDVINYEMRQQSLSKSFQKNADGSWDFTTGPDGVPTGLGADGKPIPAGGATPAAPAAPAKPAVTAPKPAAPPAKKPVVKPKATPKAAPAKKPTTKAPTVKAKPRTAPKAPPKPVSKAPVIKRPVGKGALR